MADVLLREVRVHQEQHADDPRRRPWHRDLLDQRVDLLAFRNHLFVFDNFTVYFKVENAANQEYTTFQSSNGVTTTTGENPAPPTSWLGGITVKF